LLWTGNNTDDRDITGLDFQPDLVIFKKRSGNTEPGSVDSSNPTTNGDSGYTGTVNMFHPSNAGAATSGNGRTDGGFKAFLSNGFTTGQAPAQSGYPNAGYEAINLGDATYVAWNWKANAGTATSSGSESGNNPAFSVQANAKAGFSIVNYTGTGAVGTVSHGLGLVPSVMLIKNRDVADAWAVYHSGNTAAPATDYLVLDTNAATADTAAYFNDTAPTSSVFTVNTAHNVNADGEKYTAYVFANIEGYSKHGKYIGNGNVNGTFVYTGFKPAFFMVKRINSAENWYFTDGTRNPFNPVNKRVYIDGANVEAEAVYFDFVSNGVKIKLTSGSMNGAADTYIYIAFAEQPFKYANAR
jgi:hypothetical protein